MVSFTHEPVPVLLPPGTSRPRGLLTAFRTAARSLVAAVGPRVGTRRAGSRRAETGPAGADGRSVGPGRPAPHGRPDDGGPPTGADGPEADLQTQSREESRTEFRFDDGPDSGVTAMTIVMVRASDVRRGCATVTARLAELAVNDELLVVCGANETRNGPVAEVVTTGLRSLLPRHDVVALHVEPHASATRRGVAMVGEFLEIGSLPILVTPAAAVRDLVAELSTRLEADRVLGLSCTTDGVELRQVWARRPALPAAVPAVTASEAVCALN